MKLPVNYDILTPAERKKVRETYCELQNWKCIHCNTHLLKEPAEFIQKMKLDLGLFPKGFLTHPIHLHHNHDTGMTIGAVHAKCNGILWQWFGE